VIECDITALNRVEIGVRVGVMFMLVRQELLLSGEGEADMEDSAKFLIQGLEDQEGKLPGEIYDMEEEEEEEED
jgi:hypothetical protein